MFNRETKTISNKLLSVTTPYDYKRGTGTDTLLCGLYKGDSLAGIDIELVPAAKYALDDGIDLVAKYQTKLEAEMLPIWALVDPISALPAPEGFAADKSVALTFSVTNQDPNSSLVIKHQHFCLPYNQDFYLNVIGRCDVTFENEFQKAIDLAIETRKLKKALTVKEYIETVKKEEEEAAEIWRSLESEKNSEGLPEDCFEETEDENGSQELDGKHNGLESLLIKLSDDFALEQTKLETAGALSFSAKFVSAGEACAIEIDLDDTEGAEPFIVEARNLLEKFKQLNSSSKQAIADDMLNNYNHGWAEEGEQLTNNEFLDQLHSPVVSISEFDCSIFYDTKNDLLTVIVFSLNISYLKTSKSFTHL